jgi:hypothetical protein
MNDSRTPEELNNPDYNYYLAYGISLDEREAKKIETAMAQRKNSFTQGDVKLRRLKDLYVEALEIMKENALRSAEFQKAKEFKLIAAEKTIVLIAKGRPVYKSDFIKIANNSKKWLTADEIEKRVSYLLKQGAKIIDDTKSRLDFLTYDKIEQYLKTIGKKDLYDLLSKEQTTEIESLQNAITSTYSGVSGKTDTKSTAINQICGEAKKIFKDEGNKKYYDIYLATKNIWDDFSL